MTSNSLPLPLLLLRQIKWTPNKTKGRDFKDILEALFSVWTPPAVENMCYFLYTRCTLRAV